MNQVLTFSWSCARLLAVVCCLVSPGLGDSTYSSATIDSYGSVLGWGVTDVTNYSYPHTAKVQTTLTSSLGRISATGQLTAPNWVRADVSLGYDELDVGDYSVNSVHNAICPFMGSFITNFGTVVIFRFGVSTLCYGTPVFLGGDCLYDLIEPCLVPCAAGTAVTHNNLTCPPILRTKRPWIILFGNFICSPFAPNTPAPSCQCSST